MKIKRYKRVRRILNFYKNHFAVVKPYKVLVDGTFCKAALDNKVNLREQLPIYLGDEVQMQTTSCVLRELELLGANVFGALAVAKNFTKLFCKHKKTLSAADCFEKIAGANNERKYMFATQDPLLSEKLRSCLGCPILYIKFNAVLIEGPSKVIIDAVTGRNDEKLTVQKTEHESLDYLKKSSLPEDENQKIVKKRRKIKGPNPLSCKKKQIKVQPLDRSTKRKRKRRLQKDSKRAKVEDAN